MRLGIVLLASFATAIVCGAEPRSLDELRSRLADESPEAREAVVRDVINAEYRALPADDVLSVIEPLLRTPSTDPKRSVQQGLLMEYVGRHGERARDFLPLLLKHVRNRDARDYLRLKAMEAAVWIGPEAPEVVAALETAAADDRVCRRAAELLGKMGPVAASSRPALVRLLKHDYHSVQDEAFVALGRLRGATDEDGATAEALRVLHEWRDRTPDELSVAILHLRSWGEKRERAQVSDDRVEHVRGIVARHPENARLRKALTEAETRAKQAREEARMPKELRVREALRVIAANAKDHRQRAAIQSLSVLGPGSDPTMVRTLLDATRGPNFGVAAEALRELDGRDRRSVKLLVDELRLRIEAAREVDETTGVRTNLHWHQPVVLADALTRFGPRAAPATPLLVEELHELIGWQATSGADRNQAGAYLTTLGAIADPNPQAVGAIVAVLESPPPPRTSSGRPVDYDLRRPALKALGGTGLPETGALRTRVLAQLHEAVSSSESPGYVTVGANVIQLLAPDLGDGEAGPLVQSLTALVDEGEVEIADSDWTTDLRVPAIEALASLGPRALLARGVIEEIASRELPESGYFTLPDHRERTLIFAARRALAAIAPEGDGAKPTP